MKVKITSITTCSLIWLFLFGLFVPPPALAGKVSISKPRKQAWSENVGWIDLSPEYGGVTVFPDHLEGHAWSESIGWIQFGGPEGGGTPYYTNESKTNWGVNHDGAGHLSGYAWSETIGWIDFNPTPETQVTIDPVTGEFDGFAWSESVGWIRFTKDADDEVAMTVPASDLQNPPEFVLPPESPEVSSVPEPTTGVLVGLGVLGLLAVGRRRRKTRK